MAALDPATRRSLTHRLPNAGGTPRRRVLVDRLMRALVSAGGLGIIVSVLGILIFIIFEVVPLTHNAEVTAETVREFADGALPPGGDPVPVRAMVGDEYRTHLSVLRTDGKVHTYRIADGIEIQTTDLLVDAADASRETLLLTDSVPGSSWLAGASDRGRVVLVNAGFEVDFVGDQRRVQPRLGAPVWFDVDPLGRPLQSFAAHADDDGNATVAGQLVDGSIVVVRRQARRNLMTGEVTAETSRHDAALSATATALLVDADQRNLYAGTADGSIVWWQLVEGEPSASQTVRVGSPVTALTLLIGDRSLVVGQEDGQVSVWFPVREGEDESLVLTRIRSLPALPGAVRLLSPSLRNRTFVAQDAGGALALYFSTSERQVWRGESPLPAATAVTFSPKADGVFLLDGGRYASLRVANEHPEVSWRALFGPVHYEGYEEPRHTWQSSGGTDDFESKLGLTPLIIGTLKGTVYSLLIAIPLGVLGAMYASQFMHPRLMRVVKPTVEIMAALPSVVLGFLAGLWLAPRVEQGFPALVLAFLLVPPFVLAAGAAWNTLPRALRNRFPAGIEMFWFALVILGCLALCLKLNQPFADLAFGGNFQEWLTRTTGLPYDQRNAVVVGLAMGFAVIPIIFAISEDAFSNVPKNLIAASLAMGASRWQTVTRVVLPTASPGIFSAIMIGFGRAVGETMIVLMATGNTPIMDWNPFNGFRTLSANIAVEIPEAPIGGTHYRVLFLAALILFAMTFIVNTGAELVRQRLRRKFAQL